MKKQKKKERSAGFIIVKKQNGSWRVLGLRVWGKIDIPKGHLEEDESDLDAALRECQEEAGITITKENMAWGNVFYISERPHKDVVIFLAMTDQDPEIRPNPETKQFEHDGYHWLTWDQIKQRSYPYLISSFNWAQSVVERDS